MWSLCFRTPQSPGSLLTNKKRSQKEGVPFYLMKEPALSTWDVGLLLSFSFSSPFHLQPFKPQGTLCGIKKPHALTRWVIGFWGPPMEKHAIVRKLLWIHLRSFTSTCAFWVLAPWPSVCAWGSWRKQTPEALGIRRIHQWHWSAPLL